MTKELLQQALDALTRLSFLGNGDFPGNSEGNRIAQKAVADIKQALSRQEQPSDSEYKRGFADGQKEFSEIAGGDWQTAVIDQLVVHHIYQAAHDTDPRKAIHDLLCMNQSIALDPQVSSDAQALIDLGRREAQKEQPAQELASQTASTNAPLRNCSTCRNNIGAICGFITCTNHFEAESYWEPKP